jgi:hypothetical protein
MPKNHAYFADLEDCALGWRSAYFPRLGLIEVQAGIERFQKCLGPALTIDTQ